MPLGYEFSLFSHGKVVENQCWKRGSACHSQKGQSIRLAPASHPATQIFVRMAPSLGLPVVLCSVRLLVETLIGFVADVEQKLNDELGILLSILRG